jgi:hypothetical protein
MIRTSLLELGIVVLLGLTIGGVGAQSSAQACEEEFDGTFDLIQAAIFDRRGCTGSPCHDGHAAGGLDLSRGLAYDNLVDASVESIANQPLLRRVSPAKKEDSLLWLNLAAATLPEQWTAPLRPMPQGLPPLTLSELEAIRLWIEAGAPRDGTVAGTGELLDACLPPPEPLETKPLDAPDPQVGLQIRAPRQVLQPHTEREVCFVTYYDLSDRVPERFHGPSGDTFRYKRINARQDPLSHHAVVIPYSGVAGIHDPVWGAFACGGGERDGQPCEPTDPDSCGAEGVCGSTPKPTVGCIGYGPGDASIGVGNDSLFNTMAAGLGRVSGVYAEAPLRGLLVWNSHAFNVTQVPGKLDIWVNLEFADPDEQLHQLQRFTEVFVQFAIDVPPFQTQEICAHYELPRGVKLLELSSHNHRRGKRFRIWEGRFSCQGGPRAGAPCSPFGPDPGLPHPDPCSGAPCLSRQPPAVGDCNRDLVVTVDEVLLGVNLALGRRHLSACPRFDGNGNGRVGIEELVSAVRSAMDPRYRNAEESLLYTSLSYADPAVVHFDPPRSIGGARAIAVERTLTYCGLYDNGFADAKEVKRRSTSPQATAGFPGGPCAMGVACAEGRVGQSCAGRTQQERDASCDSAPGLGDGACDACPLRFGTTTEDEMFILLGAYYAG